jgi:hypothetical protein
VSHQLSGGVFNDGTGDASKGRAKGFCRLEEGVRDGGRRTVEDPQRDSFVVLRPLLMEFSHT